MKKHRREKETNCSVIFFLLQRDTVLEKCAPECKNQIKIFSIFFFRCRDANLSFSCRSHVCFTFCNSSFHAYCSKHVLINIWIGFGNIYGSSSWNLGIRVGQFHIVNSSASPLVRLCSDVTTIRKYYHNSMFWLLLLCIFTRKKKNTTNSTGSTWISYAWSLGLATVGESGTIQICALQAIPYTVLHTPKPKYCCCFLALLHNTLYYACKKGTKMFFVSPLRQLCKGLLRRACLPPRESKLFFLAEMTACIFMKPSNKAFTPRGWCPTHHWPSGVFQAQSMQNPQVTEKEDGMPILHCNSRRVQNRNPVCRHLFRSLICNTHHISPKIIQNVRRINPSLMPVLAHIQSTTLTWSYAGTR